MYRCIKGGTKCKLVDNNQYKLKKFLVGQSSFNIYTKCDATQNVMIVICKV